MDIIERNKEVAEKYRSSENMPIWFKAIIYNDITLWKSWLNTTDNIDVKDAMGQTPLHWACLLKNKSFVTDLLERGANPWELDNDMIFPWKLAMRSDYNNDWDWHLWPYYYKQFSINMSQSYLIKQEVMKTLVAFTSKKEYHKIEALIQHLNPTDFSRFYLHRPNKVQIISPMHLAYSLNDFTLFDILYKWGIDVNLTNNNSESVLFFALACDNQEWVKKLLEHNALFPTTYNSNGITVPALHFKISYSMSSLLNNHLQNKEPKINLNDFLNNLTNKKDLMSCFINKKI